MRLITYMKTFDLLERQLRSSCTGFLSNGYLIFIIITVMILAIFYPSYIAALLVVVLFTCVLTLNTKWNFFLLIFAMPLTVVSYYIGFTFKLWMYILFVMCMIWIKGLLTDRKRIHYSFLNYLLAALLFVDVFSIFNAVNFARAEKILVQYAMLIFLTVFVINNVCTADKINRVIRYLLISGVILALYGVLQWLALMYGYDLKLPIERMNIYSRDVAETLRPGAVYIGNMLIPRARATFTDPNVFGGYINSFLPLIFSLLLYKLIKGGKIKIYLLGLIIAFLAVISTVSRTAIGGACVGLSIVGAYWFLKLPIKRVASIFVGVIVVLSTFQLIAPSRITKYMDYNIFIGRISQTFSKGDGSTALHRKLAENALIMWNDHPFIGVGIGNYGAYFDPSGPGNGSSHSAVLNFFAETGAIGGLINVSIILFLILLLLVNIRKLKKYSYWYSINVGLLASYIITILGNVTYIYYNEAFIWFLMGLIVVVVRYGKDNPGGVLVTPAERKI